MAGCKAPPPFEEEAKTFEKIFRDDSLPDLIRMERNFIKDIREVRARMKKLKENKSLLPDVFKSKMSDLKTEEALNHRLRLAASELINDRVLVTGKFQLMNICGKPVEATDNTKNLVLQMATAELRRGEGKLLWLTQRDILENYTSHVKQIDQNFESDIGSDTESDDSVSDDSFDEVLHDILTYPLLSSVGGIIVDITL